jgi:PAS domain S-box-containing protein
MENPMGKEPSTNPASPANSLFARDTLFRRFIELANDVVYAMDLQGRLQYVSPKWKDIFGTDPADVIGKDYAPLIHPDDLPRCAQALERTITLLQNQDDIEYRIRHFNGAWNDQSSNITPLLDDEGQLIGVLGIGRDITAQKVAERSLRASEERYRLLADYASDVVWTMELDGYISYISPSIERARGLTVEEAMRQPVHEALAPEALALVMGYFLKLHAAIQNKLPIEPFRVDMQYYRKDGSPYWGEVLATPAFDTQGNFKQIVGVTRNITARVMKQAELTQANDNLAAAKQSLEVANAELNKHRQHLETIVLERTRNLAAARDAAEQANRAKSVLLTNMSHELRTPLNHILGFGSLLKKEITSTQGQERLAKVSQSASALLRLIESLLDTARLESNQLHIQGVDFDLATLLDRVEAKVQPALVAKSLALERTSSGDLSQRLHGDCDRIAQVLTELLENAVKYSSTGPLQLRSLEQDTDSSFATLRFEVQDHGVGIPLEMQASMFQLFIQGDGSASRKYGGTGIGLALCQRLVNLMAGDIGFESKPGEGSLFWVEIPVSKVTRSTRFERLELAQAAPHLDKLRALLNAGDLQAHTLWTELAPQIEHLLGESQLVFEDALENYEFDRAAALLGGPLFAKYQ